MLKIMDKNDIKTTVVSYIEIYDDFYRVKKESKIFCGYYKVSRKYNKEGDKIIKLSVSEYRRLSFIILNSYILVLTFLSNA